MQLLILSAIIAFVRCHNSAGRKPRQLTHPLFAPLCCAAQTGLCMVAAAALASGFGGSSAPSSRGAMAAGIGLILASQMLAAGQLLIDQGWYYSRLQLSPLKVVGAEGLLGFVLTVSKDWGICRAVGHVCGIQTALRREGQTLQMLVQPQVAARTELPGRLLCCQLVDRPGLVLLPAAAVTPQGGGRGGAAWLCADGE